MSDTMNDTTRTIDPFNYAYGQLDGLPDVVRTSESIVRETDPLIGVTETFIIQTVRQSGKGDTIFLECARATGIIRLVLPPRVANTIARQREAATKLAQRKHGRRLAQERKDRGEQPAFLKTRHARRRRGRASE